MSSSSASDRDTSECSNSPISYTLRESPYSSPSQQVPQLTNNLTELTCTEKSFHYLNNDQPQLLITEQPHNHFRFRYVSELVGTHGCLLGKSDAANKTKTYPKVELINYTGRALIRCQLVQCDVEEDHPHRLMVEDQGGDVSSFVPEHNSYIVSFPGMGIIHTAKKDVPSLLFKKFSEKLRGQSYNPKELRVECDSIAKKINLNIVRLKFSAHDIETGKEICKPVFSEPIHNMKSAATNDLKICRMSQYSGRPRGGEDIFILVEKVNKKNVMIRFLELDESGDVLWSETGNFMQSDVHHQYAIVFRTPPYKDPQTPVDVKVFIELVRPSDGRTSDRKHFTYKAEEVYKQFKKRKTTSSYSSMDSSSGGSITNEIPITVLYPNSNASKDEIEAPPFTIQPLPLPAGSPGQCGLGSALNTIHTTPSPNNAIPYPINTMASSVNVMVSTSQPVLVGSGSGFPMTMPNLQLRSTEMDDICGDVDMTVEEQTALTEADFSQYISSFGSLSDIQTGEQTPIGDIIRASTDLVSDSGRVKEEPSCSKSPQQSGSEGEGQKKQRLSLEYDALYNPKDGVEVKELVKELCQMIKNKKGYKKQEVRSKLERLFEIRLSNGDTFLHMTLCSRQPGFESIVKIISSVNMSSVLNIANNKQQTILHLAILHGTPKIITLLIAKGCDPMLRNSEDDNVIQYAVRYNWWLLKPLLEAIKEHNVPCDLNYCNSEKQTALHLAALSDCHMAAQILLQHGASYNVRDAMGRTPLHLAAYDAKLNVLKVLADHIPASDIDAIDGSGNTALQIVCGRPLCPNTALMMEMLMKNGADPLKHEEHNESAWQLTRQYPGLRFRIKPFVPEAALEDDVKSEPEDDIKSEPEDAEDDFESADEADPLKHEEHNESAWQLTRQYPGLRFRIKPFVPEAALEDDVKSEPEDDIKSEPEDAEDDFESADENMPEVGLRELSLFAREVSDRMDASGAWQELAKRLRTDALSNWFANQPSPTYTLLHHIKECREDVTSKSLALILDEMGEPEAAKIIRGYLPPCIFD